MNKLWHYLFFLSLLIFNSISFAFREGDEVFYLGEGYTSPGIVLSVENKDGDEYVTMKVVGSETIIQNYAKYFGFRFKDWNESIWNSRNERPLENLNPESFTFSLDGISKKAIYNSEKPYAFYEIAYNIEMQKLTVKSSYKGTLDAAPFQIQYLLLKGLANKMGLTIKVDKIERYSIQNAYAKEALRADFPEVMAKSGEADWPGDVRNMKFFRSPNGTNSLDLIKKMSPADDPFSLINKVTIENHYVSPSVIIYLNKVLEISQTTGQKFL